MSSSVQLHPFTSANRGITLVFVIMALVALSFMGTGLLRLTQVDDRSSIFQGLTESARLSAQAGMAAGVAYLESEEGQPAFDSLIQKIVAFVRADSLADVPDSLTWIIGNDTTYVSFGSAQNQSYRVQLEGLDIDKMIACLRVDARGQGKSVAQCRGLFKLEGLEYQNTTTTDTSYVPMAAIHLDGDDNFETNCSLEVHGSTFIRGKLVMNTKGLLFDGPFYMSPSTTTTIFNRPPTFTGKAYFGGHVQFDAKPTFLGPVGFEGGVKIPNSSNGPSFGGTIYHNGRLFPAGQSFFLQYTGKMAAGNNTIYSRVGDYRTGNSTGAYLDEICSGVSSYQRTTDSLNIPGLMGFDVPTKSVVFNKSLCDAVPSYTMPTSGTQLTGARLDSIYNAFKSRGDTLPGGFVVIRSTSFDRSIFSATQTGTFGGKVVILYACGGASSLQNFPQTTKTANIILYVEGKASGLIMDKFSYFRGIVYVASGGLTMSAVNDTIEGAVYHVAGAKHYYTGGGGGGTKLLNLTANTTVLEEAAPTGLFTYPDGSREVVVTPGEDTLVLSAGYSHIVTRLLSRSF